MRLKHMAAILLRQYYLMRGSVARLLPLFAWVAVDILLWGFITRYLNEIAAANFNFVPVLLGAVLMWDFFTRVMQGVTTSFLEDVWSRNFLNLFATPLTMPEYVSGLVLTSIATSLVGLIVMIVLASSLFGLSYLSFGLILIPFLLVLFLFGIALGIAGAAMVLRLGPASEWFIWPIPAMISPFVGVFYPLATLPHWMQYVAYALPPSYVFEGMRAILSGQPFATHLLLWGIVLAGVYIVLAGWFFLRVYRYAVRTGLLARYSAETTA
ncbi:MAG: ABC transporter permease [Gammaproteobacteria bacterium]|nr:ABC transporter permease [Gammaproteobacteria bacterium]